MIIVILLFHIQIILLRIKIKINPKKIPKHISINKVQQRVSKLNPNFSFPMWFKNMNRINQIKIVSFISNINKKKMLQNNKKSN